MAKLFLPIEELKEEKNYLLKLAKLPTIKNSITFKKVYKYGLAIKGERFILRFLQKDEFELNLNSNDIQFGFVLSKKIGTSVKRNYIKRRLKSAIHECIKDFNIKGYYVFIAGSQLSNTAYKNIISDIKATLNILHQKIINKNACNN